MKNLSFVLWMLGYPAIRNMSEYFQKETYSDGVTVLASLTHIVIWVYVGTLLYEPKEKKVGVKEPKEKINGNAR